MAYRSKTSCSHSQGTWSLELSRQSIQVQIVNFYKGYRKRLKMLMRSSCIKAFAFAGKLDPIWSWSPMIILCFRADSGAICHIEICGISVSIVVRRSSIQCCHPLDIDQWGMCRNVPNADPWSEGSVYVNMCFSLKCFIPICPHMGKVLKKLQN